MKKKKIYWYWCCCKCCAQAHDKNYYSWVERNEINIHILAQWSNIVAAHCKKKKTLVDNIVIVVENCVCTQKNSQQPSVSLFRMKCCVIVRSIHLFGWTFLCIEDSLMQLAWLAISVDIRCVYVFFSRFGISVGLFLGSWTILCVDCVLMSLRSVWIFRCNWLPSQCLTEWNIYRTISMRKVITSSFFFSKSIIN